MVYILPTWDITTESKMNQRRYLINSLHDCAQRYLSLTSDEIIINNLLPSHLGLESWYTPKQKPNSTATWIDTEINNYAIGFQKIIQLSDNPGVVSINIKEYDPVSTIVPLCQLYGLLPLLRKLKNTNDLEILQVQYGLENLRMEGWLNQAIIYHPHSSVKIETTSGRDGCEGDHLFISGFVAEKKGVEI